MSELSFTTLNVIAWSKILLFAFFAVSTLILRYKNKPWLWCLACSAAITGFYLLLSHPLQRMWWGNNGDEIFIVSFITQVMQANPLKDFYYHELPAFYPPLYFWITGFVAKLFTSSTITAAKIGVAAALFFWFIGAYGSAALFHRVSGEEKSTAESALPWFWFLVPAIFFCLLDFNDIILKPYETFPALLAVFWIGFFYQALRKQVWRAAEYFLFGISGGLLFLTYYFWWFIIIPALFFGALISQEKVKNLLRICGVGMIMFFVAAPYIVPLFISYFQGTENWQAVFFIPKDFSTFSPITPITFRTLLVLAGIIGLVWYRKKPFIAANIAVLGAAYLYQLVSIMLFLGGSKPLQAAKPFLFLGTAALSVGCAYVALGLWRRFIAPRALATQRAVGFSLIIFSLPFLPMTSFIDDSVVRAQIEKDLKPPSAYFFAPKLRAAVPDYQERTWLSSGMPELNAYLPLHYYIAHNPHFSHPAALYVKRMKMVESLAFASSRELQEMVQKSGIDAFLLYKDSAAKDYPFFFWADNYPNGGIEKVVRIPKETIDALQWNVVYEDKEWRVMIR